MVFYGAHGSNTSQARCEREALRSLPLDGNSGPFHLYHVRCVLC